MTAATTAATGAMTAEMTAATGAMTGKTTAATDAMTGKTGVVAGPGCSGNRKLDDQGGHAAIRASGARAARQRRRSWRTCWHRKPPGAYRPGLSGWCWRFRAGMTACVPAWTISSSPRPDSPWSWCRRVGVLFAHK
jgi:hypothetical protein